MNNVSETAENLPSQLQKLDITGSLEPDKSAEENAKRSDPMSVNFLRLGLSPPIFKDATPALSSDSAVSDRGNPESAVAVSESVGGVQISRVSASDVFPNSSSASSSSSSNDSQGDVVASCPPTWSLSMPVLMHMDITHILDGLYLSDYISLSAAKLTLLGVTFVVNATNELPNVDGADKSIEFLKLNVDDVPTENIAQHFDVCADRIREVRANGGSALIHCALGISRSVSVCLAYLVKHEGRTLRQAYMELKKKRPIIRPNDGFWRQLISYEITVRGRATVKLNIYPMGVIPDVYRSAPRTGTSRNYSYF